MIKQLCGIIGPMFASPVIRRWLMQEIARPAVTLSAFPLEDYLYRGTPEQQYQLLVDRIKRLPPNSYSQAMERMQKYYPAFAQIPFSKSEEMFAALSYFHRQTLLAMVDPKRYETS